MRKATGFSRNNSGSLTNFYSAREAVQTAFENNRRECPSCGKMSIFGMPGGRDATCNNCGYKDPCCYD